MRYLKNSEVISLYGISDKTVRNWVQAAQSGQLELKICTYNGKPYIADTQHNNQLLSALSDKAVKYRNSRAHKSVTPTKKFYEVYTESHIRDMLRNLETSRELIGSYRYFEEGAKYWNQYLNELLSSGTPNILSNTLETLEISLPYILKKIEPFKYVNIVNVCAGNGNSTERFVKRIHQTGKLKDFACVDISPEMMAYTCKNVEKWTNGSIPTRQYTHDISQERFMDALMSSTYGATSAEVINIVLFVAGPIVNFINPSHALTNINESMGANDILLTTTKRDTPKVRSFFDFNISKDAKLASVHENYVLSMLGITPDMYEPEQVFDDESMVRSIRAVLKTDISLTITVGDYKAVLDFRRGERITLWHSYHHTDDSLRQRFTQTGFLITSMTSSIDQELNLVISQVASKKL